MNKKIIRSIVSLTIFFISACAPTPNINPTTTPTATLFSQQNSTPSPTENSPVETQTSTLLANTPTPISWTDHPVIPTISDNAIKIVQHGLTLGNDPHAFSKIGDGEISTVWFMSAFDLGTQYYDLGNYTSLQESVDYFSGSFGRQSQAARSGFNTSRILDPAMADPQVCLSRESPLECELREHNPSIAIISLGTNQVWEPDVFSQELRMIVEILIEHGVLPVLSTKGDNLEGDHRINIIISEVALEYDIPLWNFWGSIQILPNHGLQADHEHLTWGNNNFSEENLSQYAWTMRNLTALQVLDEIRRTAINK